jgi:hypothetical protein
VLKVLIARRRVDDMAAIGRYGAKCRWREFAGVAQRVLAWPRLRKPSMPGPGTPHQSPVDGAGESPLRATTRQIWQCQI